MSDIFLSYRNTPQRRAIVSRLAAILRAHELSVWWDYGLEAGENYRNQIMERISVARVVTPLWCAESIVSRWVQIEAELGKDKLVPALLQNVRPPDAFEGIQAADLMHWDGAVDHPRLLAFIAQLCSRAERPFHADMAAELRSLPRITPLPQVQREADGHDGAIDRNVILADLRATWREVVRNSEIALVERFLMRVRGVAPGSGLEFEVEAFLDGRRGAASIRREFPPTIAAPDATVILDAWSRRATMITQRVGDLPSSADTRTRLVLPEGWTPVPSAPTLPRGSKPPFSTIGDGTLPLGSQLGGEFEIVRLLGRGGFSQTYEAKVVETLGAQLTAGKVVALKEFFPQEIARRAPGHLNVVPVDPGSFESMESSFLEEALVLAKLDQPGIVRVLTLRRGNGTAYMVMEFIDGPTLSGLVSERMHKSGCGVSPDEFADIAKTLLSAVAALHRFGILHRDIKPANIIMRDGLSPVLIDLGGAATVEAPNRMVVMTEGYSAPEQRSAAQGLIGPYSDIYALAKTFLFALGGHGLLNASPENLGEKLRRLGVGHQIVQGLTAGLETDPRLRPSNVADWSRMMGLV